MLTSSVYPDEAAFRAETRHSLEEVQKPRQKFCSRYGGAEVKTKPTPLALAAILGLLSGPATTAQDVQKNVVYVCNGERLVIDSCNMRDLSDTSTCMVGHPDTILPNGLMKYTTETRGALKKLLPSCKQPTADQVARAKAFEKKQNDLYEANVKKANEENDAIEARAQQVMTGKKPQTPDERTMARCISSGRLPASCTGNALLGAFSQMLTSVLPTDPNQAATSGDLAGPKMAGVFQGAGNWRLDFLDQGVLVNCSVLAPDQHFYKLDLKAGHSTITIDTTPRPLVLTLKSDGTIAGPGPVIIDGVIVSGSSGGGSTPGHMETTTTAQEHTVSRDPGVSDQNLSLHPNTLTGTETTYSTTSTYVPGTTTAPHANFAPKRVSCPALNLSSKGASVGAETMQTDLLKTMFGGDKGPPTPPGIRMHGIYAAPTGFSVQFFPESVILGCGPDAARAYPYAVVAGGPKTSIQIGAPDHPLTLYFNPDGSLDPGGSGPYQVHGRIITGQDNNDNMTFAPLEQTCNLGPLTPSKSIPSTGGTATTITAGVGARGAGAANGAGTISTVAAPLGNATLSVVSGLPAQPGTPNPLAGRPYLLLRDSYANTLAKAGVTVPAGVSPYKYVATSCANRSPDCQRMMDAVKAAAISAIRADANGAGTLPGVPPGTYYLMISTIYNKKPLVWGQALQLKAGPNSVTLDQQSATPLD